MQMINKIQMASEDVKSYLHTGVFYNNGGAPADVGDGAIVVVGELLDHDVYPGTKDMNKRKITAPTANTDKVAIVDYVGVSEADVMGVNYRVGDKIYGLYPKAGQATRVRDLILGDEFFLLTGNFTSAPTVGQYAEVTANSTLLTPVATPTEGVTAVRIEYSKNLVTGQVDAADTLQYHCTVVQVAG